MHDSAARRTPHPPRSRGVEQAATVLFLGLWIAAMWLYPGGNAFDASQVGHDFFRNFLCDLIAPETQAGLANVTGAALMSGGVATLVVGTLWPLWWSQAPRSNPWRTLHRASGTCAALLTLSICAPQALPIGLPHHVATLAAGATGLLPMSWVAWCAFRSPTTPRHQRGLMAAFLVAATVNFVSYSLVQAGAPLTPLVPTAQKLALLFLLAWLLLRFRVRAGSSPISAAERPLA